MNERRIIITVGDLVVNATLNDTVTAGLVWDALPIAGSGTTWGDEIRPASAVNVVGKIEGDPTVLKAAKSGTAMSLSIA